MRSRSPWIAVVALGVLLGLPALHAGVHLGEQRDVQRHTHVDRGATPAAVDAHTREAHGHAHCGRIDDHHRAPRRGSTATRVAHRHPAHAPAHAHHHHPGDTGDGRHGEGAPEHADVAVFAAAPALLPPPPTVATPHVPPALAATHPAPHAPRRPSARAPPSSFVVA